MTPPSSVFLRWSLIDGAPGERKALCWRKVSPSNTCISDWSLGDKVEDVSPGAAQAHDRDSASRQLLVECRTGRGSFQVAEGRLPLGWPDDRDAPRVGSSDHGVGFSLQYPGHTIFSCIVLVAPLGLVGKGMSWRPGHPGFSLDVRVVHQACTPWRDSPQPTARRGRATLVAVACELQMRYQRPVRHLPFGVHVGDVTYQEVTVGDVVPERALGCRYDLSVRVTSKTMPLFTLTVCPSTRVP